MFEFEWWQPSRLYLRSVFKLNLAGSIGVATDVLANSANWPTRAVLADASRLTERSGGYISSDGRDATPAKDLNKVNRDKCAVGKGGEELQQLLKTFSLGLCLG